MNILCALIMVTSGVPLIFNEDVKAESPNVPEWTIMDRKEITDQELGLYENIIVFGTLIIKNSILNFEFTPGKGITVESGGNIVLENTKLIATPNTYFVFKIYGSAQITGCELKGLAGDENNPESGLRIYSEDVTIQDTIISDTPGSAIYLYRSGASISKVTIHNAK